MDDITALKYTATIIFVVIGVASYMYRTRLNERQQDKAFFDVRFESQSKQYEQQGKEFEKMATAMEKLTEKTETNARDAIGLKAQTDNHATSIKSLQKKVEEHLQDKNLHK